jgi:AcrR family transcriptional regulator
VARKLGLEPGQVVEAAAALADAEGLEAVTLARVAGVLGVRPPSLYSHVDGLAGLRRALGVHAAGALGATLTEAVGGLGGVEGLRAVAREYRSFALRHPGLYAAMLPSPPSGDEAASAAFAAPVRTVAAVLEGLGLPADEVVPLVRAFRSALHGFVTLEAGGGFGLPHDVDASFDLLVEVVVAGMLARRAPPRRARAATP